MPLKVNTIQTGDGLQSIGTERLIKGSAAAWVNFNGQGTIAIREAYNVSSLVDNNTGDYTINFTVAMPDTNYVFAGGYQADIAGANGTGNGAVSAGRFSGGYAAGSLRIATRANDSAGTALDTLVTNVVIFR